ncbi:MAG: hypothetical protein AAFN70_12990, partial [Planctomycetota bacterium]
LRSRTSDVARDLVDRDDSHPISGIERSSSGSGTLSVCVPYHWAAFHIQDEMRATRTHSFTKLRWLMST